MRLGKFEWYALWGVVNNGGRITMDDLKISLTGHASASAETMYKPLYDKVQNGNKALIRASRSLDRKGLIYMEEIQPPHSTKSKATALFLRHRGLIEAGNWMLGDKTIITEHSPPTVQVYDEHGSPEDLYDLNPETLKEYTEAINE